MFFMHVETRSNAIPALHVSWKGITTHKKKKKRKGITIFFFFLENKHTQGKGKKIQT